MSEQVVADLDEVIGQVLRDGELEHEHPGPGRWLVDVALARVAASVAAGERARTSASTIPHRPHGRGDPGRSLPLGRDTDAVLAEFGID